MKTEWVALVCVFIWGLTVVEKATKPTERGLED